MPNKRTGEDYLDRKPKKKTKTHLERLAEEAKKPRRGNPDGRFNEQGVRIFEDGTPVTSKNYEAYKKNRKAPPQKTVLKGKPGKIKPIGTAKGKAKLTPLKKKKK